MFENIMGFFKKLNKKNGQIESKANKDEAKERLHLVLMQDRANVSADFLDMMRQEIIDVIKKYIDVDEKEIDVRLTNKQNSDGTTGAPALYANIPIISIKNENKNKKDKNTKDETSNDESNSDSEYNEKEDNEEKNIEEEETVEEVHEEIKESETNDENNTVVVDIK